MKIGGFNKFSLADYPNNISCVVSTAGCNWRCPSCDAFDFVIPDKVNNRKNVKKKQILDFLKEKKGTIHAVVLTGGEPTIHKTLPQFCNSIKKLKYKIKLDTNGSNPAMIARLINNKLVDYISLDIKAPKEKYPQMIGFSESSSKYLVNNIERSIELVKKADIDYEFKTLFSPKLTKKDILKIAHWIRPAKKYKLQLCRTQNQYPPNQDNQDNQNNQDTKDHKTLYSIQQAISPFFDDCEIGQ